MNPRPTPARRIFLSALVWLSLSSIVPAAFAANDLVLRIAATTSTVLPGESTVVNHVGEIDVLAFSWGVSRSGTASTANVANLSVTKRLDKASAPLMLATFQGTRYPSAVLFVRNQAVSGTALDFFKITLTDLLVTSHTTSSGTNGELLEQVSFSFGSIKFDYQPQNSDGTASGGIITAGWNITANQKL